MMIILALLFILPDKKIVTEYEDIVGSYFGYSDDYSSFFHLEIEKDSTAVLLWTESGMDPRRILIVFTFHMGPFKGFAEYDGKRYPFNGRAYGDYLKFSTGIGGEIQATLLRAEIFRKNLELLYPLVSKPCQE